MQTRVRKVVYVPQWYGEIQGYVTNFLSKQHWKVARTMAWDDCTQEAYCVFLKVKGNYPQVREAKHFMALFKTSWQNHFTDLANGDTNNRKVFYEHERPESNLNDDDENDKFTNQANTQVGDLDSDGQLAIAIKQAPREIQMVLSLFLSAPQELLEQACKAWSSTAKSKAAGNKHIAKLLGLPPKVNYLQMTKDYFSN